MADNTRPFDWSQADIKSYLKGEMSRDRAKRLEEAMMDDPFLNEAVEGYEADITLDSSELTEPFPGKGLAKPPAGVSSFFGPLMIGLVGAGVMLFIWSSSQHNELERKAEQLRESIVDGIRTEEAYADSLEYLEIDLAQTIEASEQISATRARADQSSVKEFIDTELERVERSDAPKPIELLGVDSAEKQRQKVLSAPIPEVFYILDLKLADNREDYGTELFLIGDFLHGVEAVYEADSEEMRQTSEIRTVNYESIMTTALSQFEKRDYKATLLTLKRVFKKHPNDVNVAFYSGLSYYNLGKWEKANRQFRRAMAHPQRVFDQEAEWYLALSLQNQEKIAHSQTILKRIVEKEGFYAQKARALLGL